MRININTAFGSNTVSFFDNISPYNLTINWGDGTITNPVRLTPGVFSIAGNSHTYAGEGAYTITISGFVGAGAIFEMSNGRTLATSFSSFGDIGYEDLNFAFMTNLTSVPTTLPASVTSFTFRGCSNFNSPNITRWNTKNITRLNGTFKECSKFNQPIGNWDTRNVTNMDETFRDAVKFNQALNTWNTSKVTRMLGMFYNAASFNKTLSSWNTSNVTTMRDMFYLATKFNQQLNGWNVSKVTDMNWMFSGIDFDDKHSFNQDISGWDTRNVTNMSGMFRFSKFNKPIGNWNVSKVTDMSSMFQSNSVFNQPLNNWNVSSLSNSISMFNFASAFNQPLNNWRTSNLTIAVSMFEYAGAFNRDINNWNISNLTNLSRMFANATNFSQDNIQRWNTTGKTITSWLDNTSTIPVAPTINLTGNRVEFANRAQFGLTFTNGSGSFFTKGLYLEYRFPNLGEDWTRIKRIPFFFAPFGHVSAEGYLNTAATDYRVVGEYTSNGESYETISNTVSLTGDKVMRTDPANTSGFKFLAAINDEENNTLSANLQAAKPNFSIPKDRKYYFTFRFRDIKTGYIVGQIKKDSKSIFNGAQGVISEYPNTLSFAPIVNTKKFKLEYIDQVKQADGTYKDNVTMLGEKGIRIEWGWYISSTTTSIFKYTTGFYGKATFFPKFNNVVSVPPEDDLEQPIEEPGEIEVVIPEDPLIIPAPVISDPIDVVPVILIEQPDPENICLTRVGGSKVACGFLPPGTPPNVFVTVRKQRDIINIIYDGRIIISYKIDPVEFPNLVNSQGYLSFYDFAAETFTEPVEGTVVRWSPEEDVEYILDVSEKDTLGFNRPFIYGEYNQGLTVIVNGESVTIEREPLGDDLKAADVYYSGGSTYTLTPEETEILVNGNPDILNYLTVKDEEETGEVAEEE